MKISLSLEDESVLGAMPIRSLITKLMELQSRSLLVGRTLGEELERIVVVVPKLKNKLVESTSLLKTTLQTMGVLEEKMLLANREAKESKRALSAKLEAERADRAKEIVERAKENVEAEEREKKLSIEVEKFQSFMFRISEDYFHQGLRQVAFFQAYLPKMLDMTLKKMSWKGSLYRSTEVSMRQSKMLKVKEEMLLLPKTFRNHLLKNYYHL